MNRKSFIKSSIIGSFAFSIPTILVAKREEELYEAEEILELVTAAHKDLKATRKIIETKPTLINCTNQIKKGDFETAVGGASHMGRRDIADLLIAHGARLDIFNYAFLGYDDFVMKFITDYPDMINSPGPHGFSLLHHAKVGERTNLADWLMERGLTKTFLKGAFDK